MLPILKQFGIIITLSFIGEVSYFYLFVYGVTYYMSYKFVRLFIFSLKSCLFYSFRQQSA